MFSSKLSYKPSEVQEQVRNSTVLLSLVYSLTFSASLLCINVKHPPQNVLHETECYEVNLLISLISVKENKLF